MAKIKGVIALMVAAALIGLIVWTNIIPDEGRTIEDSTYVDDAQVLPENEGKRVMTYGTVKVTGTAEDTDFGLSFDTLYARRVVQRLKYVDGWQWDTIDEYSTTSDLKAAMFVGSASVGQFDLNSELIKRLPTSERSWVEEDIAGQALPNGWRLDYEDSEIYLTNSPTLVLPDNYDLNRDLVGKYRVRYRLWQKGDGMEVTLVGIQKGSTLNYDPDLNAGSTFEGVLTMEEAAKTSKMYTILGELLFAAVPCVLLIIYGVYNLRNG